MGRKSLAEERKEEILNHYYQVIQEEGYENASIAKIAAHMDIQPSLIMHYFKNKERLVFELLSKFMNDYTMQRLEEMYLETDLNKRLESILHFISDNDKFPDEIYKMIYLVRYMALSHEDINKELQETMDTYRHIIMKFFNELYREGIIANSDNESLADLFLILTNGFNELLQITTKEENLPLYKEMIQEIFKEKLQIIY